VARRDDLLDESPDRVGMRREQRLGEHVVEKDVAADANAPAEPLEIVLRSLVRMVAVDQHQVDLARIHLDRVRVAQEQLDVQAEALAELPRLHVERGGPLSEEVSLLLADVRSEERRVGEATK